MKLDHEAVSFTVGSFMPDTPHEVAMPKINLNRTDRLPAEVKGRESDKETAERKQELSDDEVNPEFQACADEIGERYREALDELAE